MRQTRPTMRRRDANTTSRRHTTMPILLHTLPRPTTFRPPKTTVTRSKQIQVSFLRRLLRPRQYRKRTKHQSRHPYYHTSTPIRLQQTKRQRETSHPLPLPTRHANRPSPHNNGLHRSRQWVVKFSTRPLWLTPRHRQRRNLLPRL